MAWQLSEDTKLQDGVSQEKVFNVAWSDAESRQADENGRIPPVGNTVDLPSATWTNSIGAVSLQTIWQDPEFDASQSAFYYVRVLEIPTPTWPVYDAMRYGLELPEEVKQIQQERAYTSPIWYRPNNG